MLLNKGRCLAAALLMLGTAITVAGAQEPPARRIASVVSVAVDEYGKGIDARGRVVSEMEYQEAVDFLADARRASGRLTGASAGPVRAALDSLVAAVAAKRSPAIVQTLAARVATALGPDAALELPPGRIDVAAGRATYERACASCHGATGLGDGALAGSMTPRPPAIGSDTAMYDVSPALMYRVVSVGIAGTPMAGFAGQLSAQERWNVIAYLTTLRATDSARLRGAQLAGIVNGNAGALAAFDWQVERSDAQLAEAVRGEAKGAGLAAPELTAVVAHLRERAFASAGVATSGKLDAAGAARRVLALLDEALAAARAGRMGDAGDKAFDAYIAFEPIETPVRAREPGRVVAMEKLFADFKGALRGADLADAQRIRAEIAAGMPAMVARTAPVAGWWEAFLQSFLIILREGLEAILVIGAIVALLVKTGHREKLRAIWVGVGAALVASAALAVVLRTVLAAVPASREVIEGATMLLAVVVLFSVSYWLVSKVEAAKWQAFIKEKVSGAMRQGGARPLAFVAFLAVFREGAETALFYQALFRDGAQVMLPLVAGIVAGAVVLAVLFTGFYKFGVKIPLRPFFGATSALLYYMAFVFMGKGLRELQEGNVLPITTVRGVPSVEALGIYPSLETLAGQGVLLALFIFALVKTFGLRPPAETRSSASARRSPPVPVAVARPAHPSIEAEVAQLREENRQLRRRLEALEGTVSELAEPAEAAGMDTSSRS